MSVISLIGLGFLEIQSLDIIFCFPVGNALLCSSKVKDYGPEQKGQGKRLRVEACEEKGYC